MRSRHDLLGRCFDVVVAVVLDAVHVCYPVYSQLTVAHVRLLTMAFNLHRKASIVHVQPLWRRITMPTDKAHRLPLCGYPQ